MNFLIKSSRFHEKLLNLQSLDFENFENQV